jgi:hypothetical protein
MLIHQIVNKMHLPLGAGQDVLVCIHCLWLWMHIHLHPTEKLNENVCKTLVYLFNDSINNSDYTVSNYMIISELERMWKEAVMT